MRSIVILSTADMNAALWTNKQHIAVRLAAYCDVHYIESLGLREPSLNLSDIRRIFRRLRPRVESLSAEENSNSAVNSRSVNVLSPRVLPWHKYSFVRFVNKFLLKHQLRSKLPSEYDLWSFSPVTYGLEKDAHTFIYHSVDLLHGVPGIPRKFFLEAERSALLEADAIVASSKGVKQHLEALGANNVFLWENVADINLFRENRSDRPLPRAIFAGNMTPSKVDFSAIAAVAESGVNVALAGPSKIDGSSDAADFASLIKHPNVNYLGVLKPDDLALELGRSTVGLIPYKLNEYTSGVFPMKVYEYLASGLQVIASPLESLANKRVTGLRVVNLDEFVVAVGDALTAGPLPSGENTGLNENSWDFRIDQIRELLRSFDHKEQIGQNE